MKIKLLQALQALFAAWVINLIVIGIGMLFILFIGAPIILLITKGRLWFPQLDLIYKTILFIFFASIFSGTVVWIKEVVIGQKQ